MGGRTAISSLSGGIFSLAILMLMLFYASIKVVHLISHHNPSISQYRDPYFYGPGKKVDLKAENIRVAFVVEGFIDGETKDDPKFVKYITRNYGKKDGVPYEYMHEYHICSKEELEDFG